MTQEKIIIFDTTLREVSIENVDDLIGDILGGLNDVK